jgi:plastocyanin
MRRVPPLRVSRLRRRTMSKQLLRKCALAILISSLSLMVAACNEVNRSEGNGSGTAATNATPSSNNAPTSTASNAGSNDASGSAEARQVEMDDDVFKPAQLTVPVGTKVTWVNKGEKAHTVVSNDKLFDSGLVPVGGQFSYSFTTPGTYSIRCAPHPKMIGQIVVK